MNWLKRCAGCVLIGIFCVAHTAPHSVLPIPVLLPPAPNLIAPAYVLLDVNTSKVLAQKNMYIKRPPASLTKLMTLYVVFQALESGQIHLNDPVRIDQKAWTASGSRMFLPLNSVVSVEQLIQGIVIASGNDACVAIAEHLAGSEETFTALMNQTAQHLGLKNTHFTDSTGLPNADHYSTPYDLALLSQAIVRDFSKYYHYFGEKWMTYNKIRQPNRNRLLWRDASIDGLKTGHTEEAGFCLVASAQRDGMRLLAVLMGAPTDEERASETQALLNYGFRFYKKYLLFPEHQAITKTRVFLGKKPWIDLGLEQPLYVTIPIAYADQLHATIEKPVQLKAPVILHHSYGVLKIFWNEQLLTSVPLSALDDDPAVHGVLRWIDYLKMKL